MHQARILPGLISLKMSKKSFILIYTLIILFFGFSIFLYSAFAEEGEDIENIKAMLNTLGNFNLKVEVEGKEGEGTPIVVDAVTTFVISRIDEANEGNSYKLYYFLDGRVSRIIDNVLLPYKFNQTYRGLLEGNYEVTFFLKDALGNYASCVIPIYVAHTGES